MSTNVQLHAALQSNLGHNMLTQAGETDNSETLRQTAAKTNTTVIELMDLSNEKPSETSKLMLQQGAPDVFVQDLTTGTAEYKARDGSLTYHLEHVQNRRDLYEDVEGTSDSVEARHLIKQNKLAALPTQSQASKNWKWKCKICCVAMATASVITGAFFGILYAQQSNY